jgi:hypothetical protein
LDASRKLGPEKRRRPLAVREGYNFYDQQLGAAEGSRRRRHRAPLVPFDITGAARSSTTPSFGAFE